MARVKKNEATMTLEEKLDRALVPDWEWPYKLPENWCWTRTGHIAEIASGGTPSSSVKEYYEGGNIPWISPSDLSGYDEIFICHGAKSITSLGLDKSSARLLPENTVCLSSRAPIGYVAIAQNPICTNQGFKNFLPSPCYLPKYLYWYLKANKELLESYASGTTFLELSASKAARVEIPLAPLAEQQRIIDRIESLFAKLDEAKEKAQSTLDSFETRKAAILHKAFTGELTAKWREQSDITKNSWSEKTLESVCKSIFDGDHMPPPKADSGIHFLVISNVNTGYLSFDNTRFVPKEYYDSLSDTRKPEKGDVLYTLVGSFGIPVIVNSDTPFCFQRHMALLKPSSIDTTFLWYLLQSQEMYQKAAAMAKGVAQLTVPIKGLRQMKFLCPTAKEQHEIVRLLDQLLIKEREAMEAAEAVLEHIDLMKKAILSRAFRGELGTNDPTEESALELLKSILVDKKQAVEDKPSKKRLVIPDEVAALLSSNLEKELIKVFYKEDEDYVPMSRLMAVSSKKFEVIGAIKKLQQKGIIQKTDNGDFKLMR